MAGSATSQSGQISGELDNPSNNTVYGSVGGSAAAGGNVCLGANGQNVLNQGL